MRGREACSCSLGHYANRGGAYTHANVSDYAASPGAWTGDTKGGLRADPDAIYAMLPALEDYVPNGTLGTVPERREAARLLLNFHWKQVLGQPHDGHQMKHHYQAPQDVPDLEEPSP